MKFESAFPIILELEGGGQFVDHPSDPGGATRWGISQRAYPNLNIRELTESQAREIYRRDYWDRVGCDFLPAGIRLAVFDCAVNQGVSAAAVLLQRAMGVKDDGVLGPVTMRELGRQRPGKVLRDFLVKRAFHYIANKNFAVFGRGWLTRLFEIALAGSA